MPGAAIGSCIEVEVAVESEQIAESMVGNGAVSRHCSWT